MAIQGLQSKKARFAQSFGKWDPRTVIFDQVFSTDLNLVPLTSANSVKIVDGVEDFVIIVGEIALIPLADPSTLTQTAFPILTGNVYDMNGAIPAVPAILPFQSVAPGVASYGAGPTQQYVPGVGKGDKPVMLIPGSPLNLYAVGARQAASNYQLVIPYTKIKIVSVDDKPCPGKS